MNVNKHILDLPYEIHKQILEYLSSEEINALLKTNTFYVEMWSTVNNSISDKTIYDSKIDTYDQEKMKKYRNIREIIIRSMICCPKAEYKEYVEFALNQKYLRKLKMEFITEFQLVINVPAGFQWDHLTHLSLSFLAERINMDRDIAHLFLQRALQLETFVYGNGHLSDISLTALAQLKSLHTIHWTNVLIYNPCLFKQFLFSATSLRKMSIYYFQFSHINLTLAAIEALLVRVHTADHFNQIKLYFEQNEYARANMAQHRNHDIQFIDTDCDDFIGIANLVLPLLRSDFIHRFKLSFMYKKISEDESLADGVLKYTVHDVFQNRMKRFCFNLNHD